MQKISIHKKTKEPIVRYINKEIILPDDLQNEIDKYWKSQIKDGRKYFNGELFALDEVIENKNKFEISVLKTNFAHLLYNRKVEHDLDKYNVNTVFSSGLVITRDNKIILGKMGEQTSLAGKLQFSGGGLEFGDLGKDGIFDMRHSLNKELGEELGINVFDKDYVEQMNFYCIKSGGNENIAIVYKINLKNSSEAFLQKYKLFTEQLNKNNILPEFEEIVFVSMKTNNIEEFIKNNKNEIADYISGVLRSVVK